VANSGLVIYEEQIEQVNQLLTKLIKGAEAKCALLVDKDGHLITRQGFTHSLDTTALAALLAGSFASTREIARLVGEPEFSVLFHQGKRDHIHINIVGERSILVIIFDDRTTIGMVRLYAKEVGAELQAIFERKPDPPESSAAPVDDQYTESVEQEMDNLFKD
jgi:predicted regulator of Ras-like GTPase activity (Roadblock/LC7/MglB family)